MEIARGDRLAEIRARFPAPLDLIPSNVSWRLATWTEPLGAGTPVLGTRVAGVALMIVTAGSSVHAGLVTTSAITATR